MTDRSSEAAEILKRHYGILGEPEDIYDVCDLSSVTVYKKFPDDFEIKDLGYFEKQRFHVEPDKKYNLIFCESNFVENKELLSWMGNTEVLTVKSYQLVEQLLPINNYFLYELIPHTVQGVPTW